MQLTYSFHQELTSTLINRTRNFSESKQLELKLNNLIPIINYDLITHNTLKH